MSTDRPASPHAVHLWLTVSDPGAFYPSGSSTLWHKWLIMGHAPAVGDDVILWDPNGEGGPSWHVRSRYWDADGTLNIQLTTMMVDPPERQTISTTNYYSSTWWTDQDGDPTPKLAAGGWLRY